MKLSKKNKRLSNLALLEKIGRVFTLERKRFLPAQSPLQKFRKKFWRLLTLRDAKRMAEKYAPNMLADETTEASARSWPERLFLQLPKRVRKAYGF